MKIKRLRSALLAMTVSLALPFAVSAQNKDPIQIGIVTSQSGGFVAQGEDSLRGMMFAIEQANAQGGVDGREVKYQVGDDESTPEAGRRVAERFARGGYNFLVGPIASSITLAISQNLRRWDALYFSTISKSDRITTDACNARMFQTSHSDTMDLAIVEPWLTENSKEQRFAVLANDYVWGQDSARQFTQSAENLGRSVDLTLMAPLGTRDFAPYISQLMASDVEAVWVALVGRDLTAFARQAAEFGLVESKRIIGHAYIMSFVIKGTDDATEGVWGVVNYSPTIDTPQNAELVKAWREKFGMDPNENEVAGYTGVQTILQGVQKAGSVVPTEVAQALSGATLETVWGSTKMRAEDHQLEKPNYIGLVENVDGQPTVVLKSSYDADVATPAPSPDCKM